MTTTTLKPDDLLAGVMRSRRELSGDVHEQWVEAIYTEAAQLADRA